MTAMPMLAPALSWTADLSSSWIHRWKRKASEENECGQQWIAADALPANAGNKEWKIKIK